RQEAAQALNSSAGTCGRPVRRCACVSTRRAVADELVVARPTEPPAGMVDVEWRVVDGEELPAPAALAGRRPGVVLVEVRVGRELARAAHTMPSSTTASRNTRNSPTRMSRADMVVPRWMGCTA